MIVVISYDINTRTREGRTRMQRVARECTDHAQRVQKSVYEACVDWNTYIALRDRLTALIDPKEDSLVFYRLGRNWREKVERVGGTDVLDPEGLLLF